MVPLIPTENDGNTCQWTSPEPEMTDVARGKRPVMVTQSTVHNKRLKSSSVTTTNQLNLDSSESQVPPSNYNLLNEPPPLGLKLKLTQSFTKLVQAVISQAHADRNKKDVNARVEIPGPVVKAQVGISGPIDKAQVGILGPNVEARVRISGPDDVKARGGTSAPNVNEKVGILGPADKLKASNFPATLLRIGQWECVSKYDGDLVAKCYFAKHKLVWEILDGRLKNKIEIQWGDIVGLKAYCPDNGPGILTIVLGKPPLFFRETDPQPRKHTVWQPTIDFTGGEASTYRQHYLQCSQGVLNKHYEKLIQCDTRLNFLSQQADPFLDSSFIAKSSINDQNVSKGSNQPEPSNGPVVSCINNTGPLGLVHGDFMKEHRNVESPGFVQSKAILPVNTPGPERIMSAQVLPVYNNNTSGGVDQLQLVNYISQIALTDSQLTTQLTAASDDKCPMLIDYSAPDAGNNQEWHDVNDHIGPYINLIRENENKMSRDDSFTDLFNQLPNIASLPQLPFDGFLENENEYENKNGMMTEDSFSDLLVQLPRIASLPKLIYDTSEDGKFMDF